MTGRLARVQQYFKNIYLDYFEVFKDIGQNARKRPVRASLYGGATLFVLNLFRTNEGLRSYASEVISACNRIGAVTESSRNPISSQFVQEIGELHCQGLLRQIDLGFSTLIYRADSSPELALFRYNCSQLKPSPVEVLRDRIIDLGVLGFWLNLERRMFNYDINEEEYKGMSD